MNLDEVIPLTMDLEKAIEIITKRFHEIENNIETFVNKYATFYYDSMTQHAEFYFEPKYFKDYDDLLENRNKMRTTLEVLEELVHSDYNS